MIVAGGRFTEEDARWVVDALLLKRDPDSVAAAAAIEVALQSGVDGAELTPRGEAAVGSVVAEAWRAHTHNHDHVLIGGVSVDQQDAQTLIGQLTREGATHEALVAAGAIDDAIAEKFFSADSATPAIRRSSACSSSALTDSAN